MLKKIILFIVLINFSTSNYLRMSYYGTDDCDGLTLHGRALSCAIIGKDIVVDPTAVSPYYAYLFKFTNLSNGEVSYKVRNGNQTYMKYKSFLPNTSSTMLTNLDSKLPYVMFDTSDAISEDSSDGGDFFKIAIFSSNVDVEDFEYENNVQLINSGGINNVYAKKLVDPADITGNASVKGIPSII